MKFVIVAASVCLCAAQSAQAQVKISQVHGPSSVYTNGYVELFNPSGTSVDVSSWSVQAAQANGNFWEVMPLAGVVPAHSHYLLQIAGAGGSTALPTPDAVGFSTLDASGEAIPGQQHVTLGGALPSYGCRCGLGVVGER
jgi:hypothetical protein